MRMDHLMMDLTPAAFRYDQRAELSALSPSVAYYGPTGADINSTTTNVPNVGDLYAWPFYAGLGGKIDQIGFSVQTGGTAGSVGRVGIYDSEKSGYGLAPLNLLFDGGQYDTTLVQNNFSNISPNIELIEGQMYWLAALYGVAAPTVSGFTSGWHGFGRNANLSAQLGWQKVGFGYQALPAVFPMNPKPGINSSAGQSTLVVVRFSTYNRMKRF